MHGSVSYTKQIELGQFWNLAQKIKKTSIFIFRAFFYDFPWLLDVEKVTSHSVWLDVRRTPGMPRVFCQILD